MSKTNHWVAPCSECSNVHGLSQPLSGDPNPYLGKQIEFTCPESGKPVVTLGDNVRLELVEPSFPPFVFKIR
jgi:hypothetical protein